MDSVALCCDILAVQCIKQFIVASIGNQLHIYSQLTKKRLDVIDTCHVDNIHEIVRIPDDKLILFGGKSLSVFQCQIRNDTIIITRETSHYFSDWIIAASHISIGSNRDICILFAHNNLCIYSTFTKEIKNISCEEKCLLYAGCISTSNSGEIVIFSGTVFQEILIWKIKLSPGETYSSDIHVSHRLKGHKGVIFSIFYDPLFKLITSTSDDRTIRVWEITESIKKSGSISNWNNVEINLRTTIFGHTARVWKSIIVDDTIMSIGEDSLVCIWTLRGELCNKIVAHNGATIWCMSVSQDKTIFTGGGDGALNFWPLIHNQPSILNPILSFDKKKTPKFLCYLQSGTLVIFFDGGELLSYNPHYQSSENSINLLRYANYCVMNVSPDRKKIALASKDGYIDIIEESITDYKLQFNSSSQKVMDSKIFSLQWLNNETILICGAQGCLTIVKINQDKIFDIQSQFILPPSRERWTTAAIIVENLLVCGDRAGSIYVFLIRPNTKNESVQFFSKIHGRLGVQSLAVIEKKLVSTGRDGTLRFYEIINKHNCDITLRTLHWKKMPMEWVSKTLRIHNDLYVLGFKEIEFMIYSTRLNRVILRIDCGGGHRSWDYMFTNNSINFACIRNKQIHTMHNESFIISDSLISGYHTKEIHTLERVPTITNHSIFVSGSEDCTFRIGAIEKFSNDNEYTIKPLETYDGHISNVKSIAVLNLENTKDYTKNIVFTGGGRSQLKVWEIHVDTSGCDISQSDLTVIEKTTFMLRGTDKIRRKTWLDNRQPYFMDPETRFMNICANFHPHDNNFIILTVASSDGFIRVLVYNTNCNDLKLFAEIPYYHRCILKIHTFYHEDQLILMSMATDGLINCWSMNSIIETSSNLCENSTIQELAMEPFEKWKAHQSGINGYDFRQNKYIEYYLATGGDDNKVTLSIFTISRRKQMRVQISATWNTVFNHTAQVTGIKFFGDNKLISAAVDQRVVMYHYSYDNSVLKVSPIKTVMTFVSDIQGLLLLKNPNEEDQFLCIYGKGLEILSINDKHIMQN